MRPRLAITRWRSAPWAALALAATLAACDQPNVAPPLTSTPIQATAITPTAASTATPTPVPTVTPTSSVTPAPEGGLTIGRSVEGRPIGLYRLGRGSLKLLLVGGIHGGYESNTIDLAYQVIDHYRRIQPVPTGVMLLIVPNANPDGLAAFAGGDPGASPALSRANARAVDLNRNWDCLWERSGVWSEGHISGGAAPFSEPETQVLRDLVLAERPAAVLFYHSALGAALGGGCGDGSAFDASKTLAWRYALAAGYNDHGSGFGGYEVTGDASNWVSKQGIPAITVELATHTATDLDANLAGLEALIAYLAG